MSKKIFTVILFIASVSVAACQQQKAETKNTETEQKELSPNEFEAKLKETFNAVVIDVCTPNEFSQQHLEGAVNLNFYADNFSSKVEQLDKDKAYFVYCWAGSRSAKAAKQMRGMGFANVYEMQGGISNWMKQNKPVEKTTD